MGEHGMMRIKMVSWLANIWTTRISSLAPTQMIFTVTLDGAAGAKYLKAEVWNSRRGLGFQGNISVSTVLKWKIAHLHFHPSVVMATLTSRRGKTSTLNTMDSATWFLRKTQSLLMALACMFRSEPSLSAFGAT